MAGFEVVEGPVRTIWADAGATTSGTATFYVGQLVSTGAVGGFSGTVTPWNIAGVADTTADQVPFGVITAINNRNPVYDSTYMAEKATSVVTQTTMAARDFFGVEGGIHVKNDGVLKVQVVVIGANSVLKGRIFGSAYGTAPSVGIVTAIAGSGDGSGFTCGTSGFDFTAVAYNAAYCCRTGLNKGITRTGYDTGAGTGAHTFYNVYPFTVAVADTFVGVNLAQLGTCKAMFSTTGTYIDNTAAVGTTNYIWIDVLELNLKEAGQEHAIFRINPLQFCGVH
jgi:hypothetical protein